jgi:hypothetical protein
MASSKLALAPETQTRALAWNVGSSFSDRDAGHTVSGEGCSGGDWSRTTYIEELLTIRFQKILQGTIEENLKKAGTENKIVAQFGLKDIRIVGREAITRDFLEQCVSEAGRKLAGQTDSVAAYRLKPEEIDHPMAFYSTRHVRISAGIGFGRELVAYMSKEARKMHIGGSEGIEPHLNEDGSISIGAGFMGERLSKDFAQKLFENAAGNVQKAGQAFVQGLGIEPYSPIAGVRAPETVEEVQALRRTRQEQMVGERDRIARGEVEAKRMSTLLERKTRTLARLESENGSLEELLLK